MANSSTTTPLQRHCLLKDHTWHTDYQATLTSICPSARHKFAHIRSAHTRVFSSLRPPNTVDIKRLTHGHRRADATAAQLSVRAMLLLPYARVIRLCPISGCCRVTEDQPKNAEPTISCSLRILRSHFAPTCIVVSYGDKPANVARTFRCVLITSLKKRCAFFHTPASCVKCVRLFLSYQTLRLRVQV